MLGKLQGTVKEDGYVIIDKAYVPELVRNNEMKYQIMNISLETNS